MSDSTNAQLGKKYRLPALPTAFSILFILLLLASIATWVIPAGSYAKLTYQAESSQFVISTPGEAEQTLPATQQVLDDLDVEIALENFTSGTISKPVSLPGTYQEIEQTPVGVMDIFRHMVNGTIEAADIMVFIMVLGGLIGVVQISGAFETGLIALTKRTKGHEFLLVAVVSILMQIAGTTLGLEEEALAFYPILVPVFIALGYDAIVAIAAIFLSGAMGTAFSTINPFSAIIASNAAGISFTEGIWWRFGGLLVAMCVLVPYIYFYARKVKADPTASFAYESREEFLSHWRIDLDTLQIRSFDWRQKLILVLFVAGFPIMMWGVTQWGWWFPEMAASFLLITIIVMTIAVVGNPNLNEKAVVEAFLKAASELVGVTIIIGLARAVNLVLSEGNISDTILHSATDVVSQMNGPLFIIVMMLIFCVLGFVVPSSSGLAVLAMPILAPLADAVGIPRFVVVSAYQWGQYSVLLIAPTGLIMVTLQMLNTKYNQWFKFVWPMVVFLFSFGLVLLVAQVLFYGS
ncbi:C4-dicarboxylate anaerobic carrier [Gleimia coleocanis DSM 15436]|uniref:C4-dicarboxylate anaerobic carrier n=1 Tax=Gleimia coleocanis DSM 15436 TaxID=525245 RepID=C0VZV0_9ACTO|nr:YfcC family protein [Gleimia coleocanis]EEH63809.1 C4-dicarboxylate anaerobic carrier [Gleimia coleocanis DSM 15436]